MTVKPLSIVTFRALAAACAALGASLAWPTGATLAFVLPQVPPCQVSGKVVSGTTPLPGVSITVRSADRLIAATSTGVDGTYKLRVAPGADYRLLAEMTAFSRGEQVVTLSGEPCAATVDVTLTLASRVVGARPGTS